jgi:HK97 family phage major capsid protein
MNLFELKEKMATLQSAIAADAAWIAEKAADPAVNMEEIEAKTSHRDELQKRFDMLKREHDAVEAKQKEEVKKNAKPGNEKLRAKAAFFRDALAGTTRGKAYEGLGGIPVNTADLGYGENLLPTNMSRELILENVENNPLREICRVTNISGLEEPKLGFTIEDADIADVTDQQTANEIAMTGDTVSYGRLKMKVNATVKDTVLHGTETDLVSAIENNLRSALAYREKHFAFLSATAAASDSTHAHMSFYKKNSSSQYEIKEVTGTDLYSAIVNAYADLDDKYAANARIVMKKADYYGMIKDLTNTSEALFSGKPAMILGIPVIFCDKATIPVIGDFGYYGINYDVGAIYETDKDAKKGEYYFVFTAWGDQQFRLKSAFRLATVDANP